jgi:hypothetical protein
MTLQSIPSRSYKGSWLDGDKAMSESAGAAGDVWTGLERRARHRRPFRGCEPEPYAVVVGAERPVTAHKYLRLALAKVAKYVSAQAEGLERLAAPVNRAEQITVDRITPNRPHPKVSI